jgi:hypothetical protein
MNVASAHIYIMLECTFNEIEKQKSKYLLFFFAQYLISFHRPSSLFISSLNLAKLVSRYLRVLQEAMKNKNAQKAGIYHFGYCGLYF